MKIIGFTGTEPFLKTTRVKPDVIFRLCLNRSVPALLIPDFCTACFLGGGRSIQLSYSDMSDFWLKHGVFHLSDRHPIYDYLPTNVGRNHSYEFQVRFQSDVS